CEAEERGRDHFFSPLPAGERGGREAPLPRFGGEGRKNQASRSSLRNNHSSDSSTSTARSTAGIRQPTLESLPSTSDTSSGIAASSPLRLVALFQLKWTDLSQRLSRSPGLRGWISGFSVIMHSGMSVGSAPAPLPPISK